MTNFIDLQAIAQQGPMFWGACLAVAMGLAMIAAATVVQTRRLGQKISSAYVQDNPAEKPTVSPKPEPVQEAKVRSVIPAAAPSTDPNKVAAPVAERLEHLLGRLDRVAIRLELVDGMERPQPEAGGTPTTGESDLKEEPQGVEYVFRAAGA